MKSCGFQWQPEHGILFAIASHQVPRTSPQHFHCQWHLALHRLLPTDKVSGSRDSAPYPMGIRLRHATDASNATDLVFHMRQLVADKKR